MPTYEYRCHACGKEFEVFQRIVDAPIPHCSLCQGSPVERLISKTSFALRGSGWYKDGYGSAKSSMEAGSDSSSPKQESTDAVTSSASSTSGVQVGAAEK